MDFTEEIALRVRLRKDVGGPEADGVLLWAVARVAGDREENRCALKMLALPDLVNQIRRARLRHDRRQDNQLRIGEIERAHRLFTVARELWLDGLTGQCLFDAVCVPRLVLDNENVFRHVRELGRNETIVAQGRVNLKRAASSERRR